MKNILILGVVAICTVLMASETTMAALGGGGGKVASRARFYFHNVGTLVGEVDGSIEQYTVAIWVRPPGTPLPATLGKLRKQLIYVAPEEIRRSKKLKNGQYVVSYGNATNAAGPSNTPIDEDVFYGLHFYSNSYTLNGEDIVIDIGGDSVALE